MDVCMHMAWLSWSQTVVGTYGMRHCTFTNMWTPFVSSSSSQVFSPGLEDQRYTPEAWTPLILCIKSHCIDYDKVHALQALLTLWGAWRVVCNRKAQEGMPRNGKEHMRTAEPGALTIGLQRALFFRKSPERTLASIHRTWLEWVGCWGVM